MKPWSRPRLYVSPPPIAPGRKNRRFNPIRGRRDCIAKLRLLQEGALAPGRQSSGTGDDAPAERTANLITETERAELLAYWRREFDRLMDPAFGDMAACETHIQYCDLPRSLVKRWTTEYLEKEEPEGLETAATGSQSA